MSGIFQVGDVVQLKSGGRQMTVEEIGADGYVTCVYFVGDHCERHAFLEATLKKYVSVSPVVRTRRV